MFKSLQVEVPLTEDGEGAVRIKDSDVLLEEIVAHFEDGLHPDEIVARHQALSLSDVFLVLAFYLKRRKDVEAYLRSRPELGRFRIHRARPKPAA